MFKVRHKLCLKISGGIFIERTNNQYNLRNRPDRPHVSFMEQKVFHILDLRYGVLFQKNLNIKNH